MKTYFNESFITVEYNEELNTVCPVWKEAPTSEEFRLGMNKVIEAMKEYNTGILKSDTAKIGAMDPEDGTWSATDWLDRAVKVGYRKFAVIISPDIFAQMSVEDTLNQVNGVEIKYFPSDAEATAWIKETEKAAV